LLRFYCGFGQYALSASLAAVVDIGFEEEPAVEPVAECRTADGGPRVFVCGGEELGEGIRLGGAVVVDQPDPLHGSLGVGELGTGPGMVESCLNRFPVPGGAGQGEDHLGVDVLGEDGPAAITASGVDADDALHRPSLGADRFQRLRQPAGAVVGDDDGGDDMPGEIEG